MNFANCIDTAARDSPAKTGVIDQSRELTFEDFAADTAAFATISPDLDIDPGDRIVVHLQNSSTQKIDKVSIRDRLR